MRSNQAWEEKNLEPAVSGVHSKWWDSCARKAVSMWEAVEPKLAHHAVSGYIPGSWAMPYIHGYQRVDTSWRTMTRAQMRKVALEDEIE